MDHGARPNVWEASALGRADLVREELAASPGLLEACSHDGWTPLHLAAHPGHEQTAALLPAPGAGVAARSRNGLANTPLQAAVAGRLARTTALLLAHRADADATYLGMTPLGVAAHNGDETIVRLLLEAGANEKFEDKEGRTPLAIAREKGHEAVARLLAERAPAA